MKATAAQTLEPAAFTVQALQELQLQYRPALIRGGVAYWDACTLWQGEAGLRHMAALAGEAAVQVMCSETGNFYGDLRKHEPLCCTFKEFLQACHGPLPASDAPSPTALASNEQPAAHDRLRSGTAGTTAAAAAGLNPPARQPLSPPPPPPPPPQGTPGSHRLWLYLAQASLCDSAALARLRQDVSTPHVLQGVSLSSCNLWMSFGYCRSSAHYDPSHNLLGVIRGRKRVRLWPPAATPHMHPLPATSDSSNHSELELAELDSAGGALRAEQQVVELGPGDALFLPEGWWHQVDSEGTTVAVNFWWESEVSRLLSCGMGWHLLRRTCQSLIALQQQSLLATLPPLPQLQRGRRKRAAKRRRVHRADDAPQPPACSPGAEESSSPRSSSGKGQWCAAAPESGSSACEELLALRLLAEEVWSCLGSDNQPSSAAAAAAAHPAAGLQGLASPCSSSSSYAGSSSSSDGSAEQRPEGLPQDTGLAGDAQQGSDAGPTSSGRTVRCVPAGAGDASALLDRRRIGSVVLLGSRGAGIWGGLLQGLGSRQVPSCLPQAGDGKQAAGGAVPSIEHLRSGSGPLALPLGGGDVPARVLTSLDACQLRRVLLSMAKACPKTLASLLLHVLSPLATELLILRLEEGDALLSAEAGSQPAAAAGQPPRALQPQAFYTALYSALAGDEHAVFQNFLRQREVWRTHVLQLVLKAGLGAADAVDASAAADGKQTG